MSKWAPKPVEPAVLTENVMMSTLLYADGFLKQDDYG